MLKHKFFPVVLVIMILALTFSACGDNGGEAEDVGPQYLTAAQVKDKLENGTENFVFLDLQTEEAYNAMHFQDSISTQADTVETDEQKQAVIDKASKLQGRVSILIVSADGGTGAVTARDLLVEEGIASTRIYILENGMDNWPYPEFF